MMEIRKTTLADVEGALTIYEEARAFMRRSGNLVQWTEGYPGREAVLRDVENGSSFVCLDGGILAGVFSLNMGDDPTYAAIHDGAWLNDKPYGTVHRIAVSLHNKGVAKTCLDWCFRECGNLRIDTHEDNLPMRNLLRKCGFRYCGIIYLPDGSPRFAFQKEELKI